MLKKAGIVAAASAATLLAVSPLAFAGDKGGHGHGHGRGGSVDDIKVNRVDEGSNAGGLIAIGEVNALNNVNVCPPVNVGVAIGDILGLLAPDTAVAAPTVDETSCVVDDSIRQNID